MIGRANAHSMLKACMRYVLLSQQEERNVLGSSGEGEQRRRCVAGGGMLLQVARCELKGHPPQWRAEKEAPRQAEEVIGGGRG